MKKTLVVLFLFLAIGPSLWASNIGSYTSSSTKRGIEAFYNIYDSLVVKIIVGGAQGESTMVLTGESAVSLFHDALSSCRMKYNEWRSIARAHLIDNYSKEISVEFPGFNLWWEKAFIGEPNPSASFSLIDGDASLVIGGTAKLLYENLYNKTATRDWSIVFISDEEIQTLLHWTDVSILKYEIQKRRTIDALFK